MQPTGPPDAGTRARPNASAGDDTARVSKRQWAKIVKKPESYTGDINTSIARSHSSTEPPGDDNFLADTAHRNTMSYDFFEGENTPLTVMRSGSTT
jgi:hypothetical protein